METQLETAFQRAGLTRHALDASHDVWLGRLPEELIPTAEETEALWALHPEAFHMIRIHGRTIPTPRWQQAYGKNYRYTGALQNALPIPDALAALLRWSRGLDERLNGLLLNWYDGGSKHYIGAHRDDTRDLQDGSPIVTLSFGEERVFRLRPWKQRGYTDLTVGHGDVLLIPWKTNAAWTHEVPHFVRYTGRRISVTIRAFG